MITSLNDKLLTEAIAENVKEYFDNEVIAKGGYGVARVNTPGTVDPYSKSQLHWVHAEGVADGRVWEGEESNWIWETGVPVSNSGVYVGGSFKPTATTTGQYAHYVNFPEGRVIFNTAVPKTAVVQAEYAYRWANFYDQNTPWFKDVVLDAFLADQQPAGSGFMRLLNDYDVRLPAVIVEPVMRRSFVPYELGSHSQWIRQDILFHVIAERAAERNNLVDFIMLKKDSSFYLYNVNARRAANDFALDWRGSPIAGAKSYQQLIQPSPTGYQWNVCTFADMSGQDVSLRLPLYRGIVRASLETVFGGM